VLLFVIAFNALVVSRAEYSFGNDDVTDRCAIARNTKFNAFNRRSCVGDRNREEPSRKKKREIALQKKNESLQIRKVARSASNDCFVFSRCC